VRDGASRNGTATTPEPSRASSATAVAGRRVTPCPAATICTSVGRLVAAIDAGWVRTPCWPEASNNLAVFFIRDAMKFPDVVHAFKPDPVTFRQEPNRIFDFIASAPETMHMIVNLFSPRGIPADYRHMQGFGVNTYKWVNAAGATHLVKYHWIPKQGVRSLTAEDAVVIQAGDLGHASKDLYEAIERGDFPEWELRVQLMSDDEHAELDFDPLDDTKAWPEEQFPPHAVGRLVLDRNVRDFFTENEQLAFGTGVLVDGMDFSDDKMLVGRTFAYSDTPCYRVGPNHLQLPVNQPKGLAETPATDQRDGQMAYRVDRPEGVDPHVDYEPSTRGVGLGEATPLNPVEQGSAIAGRLTRAQLPRTNDYKQAGERYLTMQQWERDDLVGNLVDLLGQCDRLIQERMVWHLLLVGDDLGLRVGDGLEIKPDDVRHLVPLPRQVLTGEERDRLANLGANGPRPVAGIATTHSVPNNRAAVGR